MADPHILYIILALDVTALVLWVAYVLVKMPEATPYLPPRAPAPVAPVEDKDR